MDSYVTWSVFGSALAPASWVIPDLDPTADRGQSGEMGLVVADRPAPTPERWLVSKVLIVRRHAAFTLVEIMIVVVIIGLLAAIAIPAFQRVRQRSLAARYINDFRQFESAFQRYTSESGQSPPAGAAGAIPAGMTGYLPESFTSTSPMGGNYQWSGPSAVIVLRNSQATDALMQVVDSALDDGDLATGEFVKLAGVGYGYHAR